MSKMDDKQMRRRIDAALENFDGKLWLRRAAVIAALSGAGGLAGATDAGHPTKTINEDAGADAGELSDAGSTDLPPSVAIYSAPIDPGCGGS